MKLHYYFNLYDSSYEGLSTSQVSKNKKKFGINAVTTKSRKSFLHILMIQCGSFFSLILFGAAFMMFLLGDLVDFYVVLAVVLLNSTIESIQMYRSDSIFESLTKVIPLNSIAIRDKKNIKISSLDIVPGDVLVLQAGDKVPADGLVIFAEDFRVDESILTGESKSVTKTPSEEYGAKTITDNPHAVFSGSYVTTGLAHVLVTNIGNNTELGSIVQKVSTIDTQLPLYKNIKKLSFGIFMFVLFLSVFVFFVGMVQMESWVEISKVTVALFVSAIPESLPVMITLVLAYGFKCMSDRNVLVRNMQSLDALGQIDTLCLDKTGTITYNQMKVEKMCTFGGQELYVTGNGYEPKGTLVSEGQTVSLEKFPDAEFLIKSAVLSSTGSYAYEQDKKDWKLETGDPTEVSLLVLGEKFGITKEILHETYDLKNNFPFSNQNMYHSASYVYEKKTLQIFTGAPEIIFSMCTHVYTNGVKKKITDVHRSFFHTKLKEYSAGGYRVLASCVREGDKYVCKGMFAINDSIREDVFDSIQEVYKRGVNIMIITGDHKEIAMRIAQKIGIRTNANSVLTGEDMDNLTASQLKNCILQKNIFARVTPTQKLKILELLKEQGKTVAMTGDGINDVLALVKADIGISMGTQSSDSAKEASDIILLDNKFGSIVHGIEEGKNIFSNIQKTILFLLSTNFSEIFVVTCAITLALPLPLSAIGILWLNLVTDTFLVIGFAFERGKFSSQYKNKFLGYQEWKKIIYLGLVMTAITLIVFMKTQHMGLIYAQSMTLLVLIIMQWFNVLNIRAGDHSIFTYGFRFNSMFIIGWIISIGLTFAIFNVQFLRDLLNIHPISLADGVYVVLIASSILWLEELRKISQKVKLFARK